MTAPALTDPSRPGTSRLAADHPDAPDQPAPFSAFVSGLIPQSKLRAAITAATRRIEADCLPPLLELATLPAPEATRAADLARSLIARLRAKPRTGGVESLIHEYALSSQEGVALMCLAEALLRIPDKATRDALIRDKISSGDWRAHVGQSPSMFVNAATWGLLVTGRLTATTSETNLSSSLTRLIARSGEPLIRKGVDLAMRMMGEQFVTGQTIAEALTNARKMEAQGFRYSYDMLGEAATTAEDAAHYLAAYEGAIHAIGRASAGRGIYEGPGISIKLSALHPRYSRAKRDRVMAELLPRLTGLAHLARSYDIGLNIDAEEADRLELSLDLLEALALNPKLSGWNGIGFVIQAYGKRCPFVIDWIIDLAHRSKRRIMVRLVKGAYWDSEIKRAQVDGMADYPVFTRKLHTDVSYLACARKLLDAPDAVFPQFATHNAQTLAAILVAAGPNYDRGQYEFQCLHGMGETLYQEVVGPAKLDRPCRIYAPVGTHETLLAYLVRRLLENGANSSFVNRIADETVPIDALAADPVALVRETNPTFAPHQRIGLPPHLYGPGRTNSAGLDLADEDSLRRLASGVGESVQIQWTARSVSAEGEARPVLNPADARDVVGQVWEATGAEVEQALAAAAAVVRDWAATSAVQRAAMLRRAADAIEARMPILIGLMVREAGKSFSNAIAEVREAVDFMRYYAEQSAGDQQATENKQTPVSCPRSSAHFAADAGDQQATENKQTPVSCPRSSAHFAADAGDQQATENKQTPVSCPRSSAHFAADAGDQQAAENKEPLGPVVCISPWNFPLAIFTGQVAAALAAGNTVLAKPAEETPLVAAEAVRLLHAAGIPLDVCQLVPGDGAVGAALVADSRVQGVMFTGSTAVARLIHQQLSTRLTSSGQPVPLIAETGGQNALVVDSSALAEQVVGDVIASAFDSAGQRCSALRILCLQEDVADRILTMLKGAVRELEVGNPDRLSVDVGPVISAAARDEIRLHIDAMRTRGHVVEERPLPDATMHGSFVAPTIIEIGRIADVQREVFGPVLHVLRYRRATLDQLIDQINGSGYGLTFGLHTRIDETITRVLGRIEAGNVYVNRNIIGAVVGVQPFGGTGLSGTGPKAGGPLYLSRLSKSRLHMAPSGLEAPEPALAPARRFVDWLRAQGFEAEAERCTGYSSYSAVGASLELPGPVGERNVYTFRPRGRIAALAQTEPGLLIQIGAILATGNKVLIAADNQARGVLAGLPAELAARITFTDAIDNETNLQAVLFDGDEAALLALNGRVAAREGAILQVQALSPTNPDYDINRLLEECSISTNTSAAGGNASLMSIG